MTPIRALATSALLGLVVSSCTTSHIAVEGDAGLDPGAEPSTSAEERDAIAEALDHARPTDVLVVYRDVGTATALTTSPAREIAALVPAADQLFVARAMPIVALRLRSVQTLDGLLARPDVLRVERDRMHEASASPSLELIRQPTSFNLGGTGAGYTVAVLDTGADYTVSDLGSCSSAGPSCGVAAAIDFAPDDGSLDGTSRHGTNVSSIIRSVAPQVKIVALDVFTGDGASSVDIARAADWVVANKSTYSIVAANLSLGYGSFTSACGSDVLATAISAMRNAGVVPVVATGNSGYLNAISSPACAPGAVSVGAVDSSGVVASFSNSASFATLLAPGVGVNAGGITMSGTSQATPHVAGSIAALRSLFGSDSASQAIARLTSTGVSTRDSRNGISLPRLDLGAAAGGGGSTTPPAAPDTTPPNGTLAVDSPYAMTTRVNYAFTASDTSAITGMCMTASTTCRTFVTYSARGTFTLPSGDGNKTVVAWLRDAVGNVTATPLTASTVLDTAAPTGGTLTAVAGIRKVTLTIGAATDRGSGVAGYRIVYSNGTSAPSNCSSGTSTGADVTSAGSFVHENLTAGTPYRYRVCAVDRAGRVATGVSVSSTPVGEFDPPVPGTLVIAGGATWTRSTSVSVALSATDASGVAQMCLSSTSTCTAWTAYATTKTFTLGGSGTTRTVNAWFRDIYGNTTASPISDTINLDTVAPTNPTVAATAATGAAELSWSDPVDATSGLARYLVQSGSAATTSRCTGGRELALSGNGRGTLRLEGPAGTAIRWRICAVDAAGNVGTGASGSTTPR
jgi:Subtilase family